MIYLFILILVILIGFVTAYQSEADSQDCTQYCTHWVHDNRSRWRHDIKLNDSDTTRERIGLMHSVVEWRRSLIITIVITIPICLFMIFALKQRGSDATCFDVQNSSLRLFVLSFVYVFIVVFFIAMYYQELWHHALRKHH